MDNGLLELFFSESYEDSMFRGIKDGHISSELVTNITEYILSLLSIPYEEFIKYKVAHPNFYSYSTNEITQCSNPVNCHVEMCSAFHRAGNRGLTTKEIAYHLYNDNIERTDNTMQRYGRDQVMAAKQLGLTQWYNGKWYLSTIGSVFLKLTSDQQQSIMARCLLRDTFYSKLIINSVKEDIVFDDYIQSLSKSSAERRRSGVRYMYNLALKESKGLLHSLNI